LGPDRKELLNSWFLAGVWIGLIAVESTDWFSAEHTSRFLYPIFRFLLHLDPQGFESLHHSLRKIGHFVGYFVLSALLFRAWKHTLQMSPAWAWAPRWAAAALAMSVLIASLDEWHQTFLPSRTGRIADVALDGSAALAAQFVIYIFMRRISAGKTWPAPPL